MHKPQLHHVLNGPRIRVAIPALCISLIIFTTLESVFSTELGGNYAMKDYDAFHVAGRLFWEGRLSDAYNAKTLLTAQREIVGADHLMPWTYPPHFNFIPAALALLPIWMGYLIFTLSSFVAYMMVLRRLAGDQYSVVLLALFPAIAVCIRAGQNGLLLGALTGAFALLILKRQALAGLPLALLTIKPHYLPGIGLYLLLRRAWKALAVGAAMTVAILGVATAVFGAPIWAAFVAAIGESGRFLELGAYPLSRMTSLYAALHTLGVPPAVAMTGQGLLGLAVMGGLFLGLRRGGPPRHLLGFGIMGTMFFSPYSYDYDLPILGVAFALLMPDLLRRGTPRQLSSIFLMAWVAGGSGLLLTSSDPGTSSALVDTPLSLGAWALIPLCLLALRVIRQTEQITPPRECGLR